MVERAQATVQRTGGSCASKVTLLPLLVNGWHTGPFCGPRVRSGGQKTGCASRGIHVWSTGELTAPSDLGGPVRRIIPVGRPPCRWPCAPPLALVDTLDPRGRHRLAFRLHQVLRPTSAAGAVGDSYRGLELVGGPQASRGARHPLPAIRPRRFAPCWASPAVCTPSPCGTGNIPELPTHWVSDSLSR